MKLTRALPILAAALLFAATAGATSLEIGLNDDSVQGQYFQSITEDAYGTAQFGLRGLYNDDDKTKLLSGEISFIGRPGNVPGLTAGVGGMLWGGKVGDSRHDLDILSLGIGARLGIAPPSLMGLGFDAKLFYAPKILTTGDSERVTEGALRASYAFIPKARIFVEYQVIHVDFERGDGDIDDDLRIGFEARF